MTLSESPSPLGSNVRSLHEARIQQDFNRVFAQHRDYANALVREADSLHETSLLAAAGGGTAIGSNAQPSLRRKPALVDGFAKLADRWELNQSQQLTLLGLSENAPLGRLIIEGKIEPPLRDIQDRIALLLTISIWLGEMYDDDRDAELKWLHASFDSLNAAPIELLLKGPMVQILEVHNFLRDLRSY